MNPEELQKQIAIHYKKLPSEAQAVFSSMAWLETLKTICEKYAVNKGQEETIGTETTLVLLGIIHEEEYKEIIERTLGLPNRTAMELYQDLSEFILKTVRIELNQAFERNKRELEEQNNMIDNNLDSRFAKLPSETKNAISESAYQDAIYSISQNHNLTTTQTNELEMTTVDFMLGNMPPDKFEESVKNRVQVTSEKAHSIVNEVNEQILKKIRETILTPKALKTAPIESREDMLRQIENPGLIGKELELMAPKESREIPAPMPAKETLQPVMVSQVSTPASTPVTQAQPIMANKLSGSFQIPKTETTHTLENISKPQTPKTYPKNADPYRMSPTE